MQRIIIVGGGVAGSEAGTYLGQNAQTPVEIIETNLEANEGVIHIVDGLLAPLESIGS